MLTSLCAEPLQWLNKLEASNDLRTLIRDTCFSNRLRREISPNMKTKRRFNKTKVFPNRLTELAVPLLPEPRKQLFCDNQRKCWLCWPDGKIRDSGLRLPILGLPYKSVENRTSCLAMNERSFIFEGQKKPHWVRFTFWLFASGW